MIFLEYFLFKSRIWEIENNENYFDQLYKIYQNINDGENEFKQWINHQWLKIESKINISNELKEIILLLLTWNPKGINLINKIIILLF